MAVKAGRTKGEDGQGPGRFRRNGARRHPPSCFGCKVVERLDLFRRCLPHCKCRAARATAAAAPDVRNALSSQMIHVNPATRPLVAAPMPCMVATAPRARLYRPVAPHEIRHHQRRQRTEDACADAVEQAGLRSATRCRRTACRAQPRSAGRRSQPGGEAYAPGVGRPTHQEGDRQHHQLRRNDAGRHHGPSPIPVREGELLTTNGSSGALAKWKSSAQQPKMTSGRHSSSTLMLATSLARSPS